MPAINEFVGMDLSAPAPGRSHGTGLAMRQRRLARKLRREPLMVRSQSDDYLLT